MAREGLWIVLGVMVLLGGCQPHTPAGAAAAPGLDRLSLLRAGAAPGFARAAGPRRFEFPADHGPHPQFRHEWWYFTGQLQGADGERFGFELTVFRLALRPPSDEPAVTSAWQSGQLYAAHFAITDLGRRRFFTATRYARDALGLAGARAQPFALQVADWSVMEVAGGAALHWRLEAADSAYQLQLDLSSDRPPVLNGEGGLSRKADALGAASYYYSMPRLNATGRLIRAGTAVPVSGLVWLDREWGSGALGAQQQGWDWFALDFEDGSSLMFYALRDRDGSRDPHSAGTFVDAAGGAQALGSADVQIQVLRQWRSPRGGSYPAQWRLRVPALDLELQVVPLLADQELPTQPRYWEGAVRATGQRRGAPLGAAGYVELVGYAQDQASTSTPSATTAPGH